MTFPKCSSLNLRTDESFRLGSDPLHHKGESPFEKDSLHIDMIFSFPLDYMHLVCLGVMKMLLKFWTKEPLHKFNKHQRKQFDNKIMILGRSFSSEFQRTGRVLMDIDRWKAVEFRTFLLYSGPIILKDILTSQKYQHFLYFHVAIRILASKTLTIVQIDFAESCLVFSSTNLVKYTARTESFTTFTPSSTWLMIVDYTVIWIVLVLFRSKHD